MPRVCQRCRRANPREAAYCYFDGGQLEARAGTVSGDARPVDAGARPFSSPFVLPSGRACHNFNELAVACHRDPTAAQKALGNGRLESFLAGQGRADLAGAARRAAQSTDRAQGLDEFLGGLPAPALLAARLRVEPLLTDLGTLRPGEERRFELVLHNDGMRLLTGSAACDARWLSLGDGPVQRRKLFQFTGRHVLPVRVVGRNLGAYRRPQEAEIRLESSGGTATALVRVQVPVRPFPEGPFAGALSPRELAEKARAALTEAATLIEAGAVARWYADNGWRYPVFGPTASGPAAVQQLFEALGFARTPGVDLSEEAVQLRGRAGEAVEYVLAVVARENRPAVAFATSDRPWLVVGPTVFRGRNAMLPLSIPAVPAQPGQTLEARVSVTANGGQRFVVPVTLTVSEAPPLAPVSPALAPAVGILVPPAAKPRAAALSARSAGVRPRKHGAARRLLIPLGLLGLGFFLSLVLLLGPGRNLLSRYGWGVPARRQPAPDPVLTLAFQDDPKDEAVGAATMTFGLVLAHEDDPDKPGKHKRLTFDERGRTNNTCYRLDGQEFLLGYEGGHWETLGDAPSTARADHPRPGRRSLWLHQAAPVAIEQRVEVIAGSQSGQLDTCLVRYTVENRDKVAHNVALRVLLDTFIGSSDGVPFAVPGTDQLCDTMSDRQGADVPDFLEALEADDLKAPGTVAHLGLRLGGRLEPPGRVTLGAWPDQKLQTIDPRAQGNLTRWDVPLLSLEAVEDSAVTVYWLEKPLAPGTRWELGFTYGLGAVAAGDGQGRLGLTVGGAFTPGGAFTLAAYVKSPVAGETLTLELPAGLTLAGGQQVVAVPPLAAGAKRASSLVCWKLQSAPGKATSYPLQVRSSAGPAQACTVKVQANRAFD